MERQRQEQPIEKKEYCDMNVVKEKRNLKEYKIRDDGFGLNEIYLRLRKN